MGCFGYAYKLLKALMGLVGLSIMSYLLKSQHLSVCLPPPLKVRDCCTSSDEFILIGRLIDVVVSGLEEAL